jgi:hypothetical protein
MNNIALFYKFLEKEGIKDRFLMAFNNSSETSFHIYASLEEYLTITSVDSYIVHAFSWSRQGGMMYWANLSAKWHTYLAKPDILLSDNINNYIKLL